MLKYVEFDICANQLSAKHLAIINPHFANDIFDTIKRQKDFSLNSAIFEIETKLFFFETRRVPPSCILS